MAHEFTPDKQRFFWRTSVSLLIRIGVIAAIVFAYYGRILWTAVPLIIVGALGMAAYATLVRVSKYRIAIEDGTISGYAPLWRRRISIPLDAIDCEQSGRQGIWPTMRGYAHIVSRKGDQILLSYYALDESQVEDVLASIGCDE